MGLVDFGIHPSCGILILTPIYRTITNFVQTDRKESTMNPTATNDEHINLKFEHAQKSASEHQVIQLNAHDSEVFLTALAEPVKFNQTLLEAFELHSQRVTSLVYFDVQ
ncbi:MAG: DUF1778 domain-containing protein [Algicola sp.]|nr:DUF1778 domain-containing protein [Algicola sp.]